MTEGDVSGLPLPETETLVERAIQSVLHSAPGPSPGSAGPQTTKAQPWAETAAPPGKNKRSLEELLEQYASRLAAAPDARAAAPDEPRPAEAFFERLSRRVGSGRPSRKRRQRSGGRAGQRTSPAAGAPSPSPPADRAAGARRPGEGSGRRRRGRRRRRRG